MGQMGLTTFLPKVRNNPVAGLSVAALLIGLAILLRMTTPVTLTYVTFYPAVILATVAGGRLHGLAAMLVATVAAWYFIVRTHGALDHGTTDLWNAGAFWTVCLLIIFLTDLLVELLMSAQERTERLEKLYRRVLASEKQQHILMDELSHRMKNQYSVILAMARATEGSSTSIAEFQAAFSERLQSMSRAHSLLTSHGWAAVSLTELIKTELQPFAHSGRVELHGPDVKLKEQAVVNFGMALHELATNSAKHGAWSGRKGKVILDWTAANGVFRFTWQERDGPTVSEGERRGFGRLILEKVVPASVQGESRLDFAPDGLRWTLTVPSSCEDIEYARGGGTSRRAA